MEHYALFVLMSVLLIILPGPDTGVVTQNTVFHGRAGGMKTVLGSTSGLLIHTLAVVCGISAILVKSAFLFSVIKYVGAVYLLYLGLVSLWSLRNQETAAVDRPYAKHQSKSPFLQGFLTNVLNPKVAVFFLTFLPQFVKPGSYAFLQFFALGLTYTLLTVAWFFLYVQFIDRIRAWMKKASTQRAMQGITGLALVAFGITLALEKRP